MAGKGGNGRTDVGSRDMTPEECAAMERATLRLQEEIRELLASRPFAARRAAANGPGAEVRAK